jgi:small subunit ribosomal protein S18
MRSKMHGKNKAKEKKKRLRKLTERGPCRWCRAEKKLEKNKPEKPGEFVVPPIDYKNIDLVQRFVSPQGKIFSRKRSGSCGKHQRQLKIAVKHARLLALIPYVG